MQENQQKTDILKYIGIVILATGVLMAGAIVLQVFEFFARPAESIIVQHLTTELSKTGFMQLNERPLVLQESGAFAVSVFLFAMLIWTASSLSHHLIKSGLSIVMRNYTADLSRMKLYVAELAAKIERSVAEK